MQPPTATGAPGAGPVFRCVMSYSLSASQDAEVTFESGIAANGTLAAQTFWTWNNDSPATYGGTDYEAKYGAATAGTGATITYSFTAASNWTATEEHAFQEGMALWSSVANVTFREVASGADFTITRGTDGTAEAGTTRLYTGTLGTAHLGTPTEANLTIDTSKGGFGPLGDSYNGYGGYPWMTLEHELGHILGLGHSGAYDEGVTTSDTAYGPYDSRAYSLMSYLDPPSSPFGWTITSVSGAREEGSPVTPQMIDIAAAQRIYGLPTDPTLAGGQTFGFHSNIGGPIASVFDFTQNSQPIVTLWDGGTGNTLDLSGFTQNASVDLHQGAFSSAGGLSDNIGIAYGARIDAAIGGPGADTLLANDDGDTLMGGDGNDTLQGGAGADQLFGNAGDDVISGSGGVSWAFGNQGNDHLSWTGGAASLFGGQGADVVAYTGAQGAMEFGNLGDDVMTFSGAGTLFGGQGNDTITVMGAQGVIIHGDLGDDTIVGGSGADLIIGGQGADVLTGGGGADRFAYTGLVESQPTAPDHILDFDPTQDTVEIGAIDAGRAIAGQPTFHWVASFDGGAGEAALSYDAASNTTTLMLDADGDRHADFAVVINGHLTEGGWLTF